MKNCYMEILKKIISFLFIFYTILLFPSCQKQKKVASTNVEAAKEYSKFKIKNASFVIRPILNIFLGDSKKAARTAVSRMTAYQQKILIFYI